MPSLFADRFETIARPMIRTQCGYAVTIRRGPLSTAVTEAMHDGGTAAQIDTDGLPLDYEAREWTVAKAAYVFAGVAREPQAHDWIVDADGTWEVLPDPSKPAWHSSGDDWIIRTKRVA